VGEWVVKWVCGWVVVAERFVPLQLPQCIARMRSLTLAKFLVVRLGLLLFLGLLADLGRGGLHIQGLGCGHFGVSCE